MYRAKRFNGNNRAKFWENLMEHIRQTYDKSTKNYERHTENILREFNLKIDGQYMVFESEEEMVSFLIKWG